MGPVFSSAFVIPLVVGVISASGKGGGIASPISVLIAAVGVFALGWIVSSYAKEIHAAGSLYDYVTRGLGERVGTAAGWLYYGGVTVLLTGLLLLIGGYLQSTIASEFKVNPLPAWAWTLIVIALIAAILYFGVRLSTRSQLALALVSMIVVLIFFITVIVKLGSANSFKPFNPSSAADGWSGIFFGVLYGVLLFVGFETAANLAEETPNPRREIPIAVMTTAGIATVFFVLATYVEVAGFHYSLKTSDRGGGGAAVRAGRTGQRGRVRRHLDRPAAGARGAVRHARGRDRLRGVRVPRNLRDGPRPPDPGAARDRVQAARLAAGRHGLRRRGIGGDPAGRPVLDRPVRAARHPALLRAVRVGLHVRRLRARRGLPADGGRLAAQLRGLGATGALVISAVLGILITAGAIFGSFYKVTSPTILAPWFALALLAVGFAVNLGAAGPAVGQHRTDRPERQEHGVTEPQEGLLSGPGCR